MAVIREKGMPTRNTKGGVGDIYIDVTTGRQFKCTSAYGSSVQSDYGWTPIRNGQTVAAPSQPAKVETKVEAPVEAKKEVKEEVKEEVKPEPKKSSKPSKQQKAKAKEPAEEVKEEVKTQRTNYSAAYENAKKEK